MKRITAMVLALCMVMMCCACRSGEEVPDNGMTFTTTTTEMTTATTTTTTAPVDLQAQANAEVKAYFASFANLYTGDENGTVQVIAPDFGAIADKIGQQDAASLTTAEQWQAVVEEHAELTKMYIMTVDEVSDEAVEAAFLDQVLTELFKRWVAQMDLTLLEPGERRDS